MNWYQVLGGVGCGIIIVVILAFAYLSIWSWCVSASTVDDANETAAMLKARDDINGAEKWQARQDGMEE